MLIFFSAGHINQSFSLTEVPVVEQVREGVK